MPCSCRRRQRLDRGGKGSRRSARLGRDILRARDVAGHIFGALSGIDEDSAAVGQYAPHVLGADFLGFLVRFGERRLMDAGTLSEGHIAGRDG